MPRISMNACIACQFTACILQRFPRDWIAMSAAAPAMAAGPPGGAPQPPQRSLSVGRVGGPATGSPSALPYTYRSEDFGVFFTNCQGHNCQWANKTAIGQNKNDLYSMVFNFESPWRPSCIPQVFFSAKNTSLILLCMYLLYFDGFS